MAFTGVPVVQQISDRCVRVTGLSLAAAASGVLGLYNTTVPNAVPLPDAFNPKPYEYLGVLVALTASIRVTMNPVTDIVNFGIPIRVTKTGAGISFAIAFENDAAAVDSGELEIYIDFRD